MSNSKTVKDPLNDTYGISCPKLYEFGVSNTPRRLSADFDSGNNAAQLYNATLVNYCRLIFSEAVRVATVCLSLWAEQVALSGNPYNSELYFAGCHISNSLE